MTDRADDAHLLPPPPGDRAAEHPVGVAGPVYVGGEHGVDPLIRRHERQEAVVVEGLAEMHEPTTAPGADGDAAGFDMGRLRHCGSESNREVRSPHPPPPSQRWRHHRPLMRSWKTTSSRPQVVTTSQ
jgi:hypothetical protein